jgi:hypothetical protein
MPTQWDRPSFSVACRPAESHEKVAQALLPAAPAIVPALGAASTTSHAWELLFRPCRPPKPAADWQSASPPRARCRSSSN